jgi:DNA topoisomerase-1
MAKNLVIVESPAKSKTIEKYLGPDFAVTSSKGHIRDLATTGYGGYGVDLEDHFKPKYKILKDKKEVVKELKAAAKAADKIYLATDPDREGEAISWHLYDTLDLENKEYERIVFHEITKPAVIKAFENGRDIDLNLVKSQESRRIVDRIIGFSLSKLLQKKIGSKSAGRVQSIALKIIVDREKEIKNFIPEEYWEIYLEFDKNKKVLKATLERDANGKLKLNNQEETDKVLSKLDKDFYITDIAKKVRNKSAKPPFITSSLQQEASSKYNYNAKRTMSIAQRLYEGISERVGLITYMRTDSFRLSNEFIGPAKDHIIEKYGEEFYHGHKEFKTKNNNIQDAHEAIRPSSVNYTPEKVKKYLSSEEYKIYSLIYSRAVASLMSDAKIEDEKLSIDNNGYIFELSGEKIMFEGYLAEYSEYESGDIKTLPEFTIGEQLENPNIIPEQKFTNAPPRFSEARVIKKMEELGIGRPSTYAVIMDTLKIRNYVKVEKRMFIPSEQGILTSDKLDEYFSDIINPTYTANMERILDEVSEGNIVWYEELDDFYKRFKPLLEFADEKMEKIYPVVLEDLCPECGSNLVIRRGRFGEFVACGAFPKCRYIRKEEKDPPKSTGIKCTNCEVGMIVERVSKRGRSSGKTFYACDQYPNCKTTYTTIEDIAESTDKA